MKQTIEIPQRINPFIANVKTDRLYLIAQWALFLDQLEIKWQIAQENHECNPAFWLPTFNGGMFIIIQEEPMSTVQLNAAKEFCLSAESKVWLAIGQPDYTEYSYLDYNSFDGVCEEKGIPNACDAQWCDRMYTWSGFESKNGKLVPEIRDLLGTTFNSAVSYSKVFNSPLCYGQ